MNTPNTDDPGLPADDADQAIVDALLRTAAEPEARRDERIERVLQAVDQSQAATEQPAIAGRIRPKRWLGPAGVAAAVLIVLWVIWPSHTVETAQAAMARVSEVLQSAEHRRYEVTLIGSDDKRQHGTVDLAQDGRFVGQFNTIGPLGRSVSITTGCNGERYWLVTPVGPVQVSDQPFGPLFPTRREGDPSEADLLTLPRAIATLQDGFDFVYADTEDPKMMRLIATRKRGTTDATKINAPPILVAADVTAQRDSGEVVQVIFTLDKDFAITNRPIQSIIFKLQPDAETPEPDWYEHEKHHDGRPVIEP